MCGAQLSQPWSGEPASVIPLGVVDSILLGLIVSVLEPLMASGEFPQASIYGWSRSADTTVRITCADISGVSPCQLYLV